MKFLLFILTLCALQFSVAQVNVGYQMPHADILQYADVDLPPITFLNDAKTMAVFSGRDQYKSLAELSEQEMRLAGLRINPVTNIGSRTRYYNQFTLYNMETKTEIPIQHLPNSKRFANFSWSPEQTHFAFTNTTKTGVELWVVNVNEAKAHKISTNYLNANMGSPFDWIDNSNLLVKLLPESKQNLIDQQQAIPDGPTISENAGEKAQNRTYQDLLSNEADEFNFEQLTTSTLQTIGLDGTKSEFLPEGIYRSVSVSPDGNHVMISEVQRPYSYLVPYYRFPFTTSVYNLQGNLIAQINDSPLDEERPKGFMSTKTGKRSISWRSDKPASLVWVEALDGGDANIEAEFRDEIFTQDAPFTSEPKSLGKTTLRYSGIQWGDVDTAVLYEYWWNNRTLRTVLFDPTTTVQQGKLVQERNYQDIYSDLGEFVTRKNEFGKQTLWEENNNLYLIGDGFSDEGILPFFDELDVNTLEKHRIWQAELGDELEEIVDVIDAEEGILFERIESPTSYPNYFIRDINSDVEQVTFFSNPFEGMNDVSKEVIEYKRADGVDLSATLYLPADYDKNSGEQLPMLLWAYPREYKDSSTAGQKSTSPNEFTYPHYGSPIYWVNRGYAILDDAAFPIVGEGENEPNDSFIDQLVANAEAAIDAVGELGYIDRERVAVGGHSYGAFMTANLLTHSDLFAAGIARSGAYNRSLTPFGFQSEERNFWEASDVYFTMSPFMNAEKMNYPLLLIHGEADNNSGTYPMQSERYFNALKGLGATVRLVMLPKESHGYRAKENIMHMLWEQDQWLEKHVKNKQ